QGRCAELESTARAAVERFPVPAARCMLAVLLVDLGREPAARREFEQLAGEDFADLERINALDSLLPWLSEISVYLGDTRRGERLYERLLRFEGRTISLAGRLCFGPAAHYLGLLATMMMRW